MEFVKQLGVVLQGEVKPMITQCCIVELYKLGRDEQPAVDLAKTFERRKCNHREAIPGDECLISVVGDTNKHRYVIATQSQPLRAKLRAIPAVPIVHVKKSVMVLEPPSDETMRTKQDTEEHALHPLPPERAALPAPPAEEPKRKPKGPKGPNPLSMKKKILKPDLTAKLPKPKPPKEDAAVIGEKRKRPADGVEGEEEKTGPKKKKRRRKVVGEEQL